MNEFPQVTQLANTLDFSPGSMTPRVSMTQPRVVIVPPLDLASEALLLRGPGSSVHLLAELQRWDRVRQVRCLPHVV